jgi:hypothetical protein
MTHSKGMCTRPDGQYFIPGTDRTCGALKASSTNPVLRNGFDYNKAVVEPSRQVAPLHELRGVVNNWAHIDADVLLLEGEIHLYRKPGFLQFTTPEARDAFSMMVLESFRPAEKVMALARRIADRMTEANGGRQWMGAHMRRGDCKHDRSLGDSILMIFV